LDAGFGREARKHRLGVGPTGHQAGVDERAGLDVLEAGLGQRFDEPDLVSRTDGPRFDLEAFARPFLVDLCVRWQVGHGHSSRLGLMSIAAVAPGPRDLSRLDRSQVSAISIPTYMLSGTTVTS